MLNKASNLFGRENKLEPEEVTRKYNEHWTEQSGSNWGSHNNP